MVEPAHTEVSEAGYGPPIAFAELPLLAGRYHETYLRARPWPHLVLDDLLDPEVVAAAEAQELQRALNLEIHRGNRIVKAESPEVGGHAANEILDSLLTPEFVAFLEKLTGIGGLIPDPSHAWAGIHVSPPGASQALHRDFRFHPANGLYHRVNVLVFLNSDWKTEYGGQLELWPSNPTEGGKQILPEAARIVIFETTSYSFHGVPEPIRCPPGRARLSLASYYYTDFPGPADRRETMFLTPKRPQDPWYMSIRPPKDCLSNLVYGTADFLGHGGAEKWARGRRFRARN
jgi:Rps23 Pro-64 3,4-dihydroxylase Tpa1-like proline 4-hydroxylase